ncbi:ferric reductase-like transmembrane domain-containing protein [Solicola sp. PLA-1-18]|uniref:ferredoxin reductase family protein n=1 Tax=Solicola sp. PLA-1-18 TaxID=3380532 RepID=UPI003B7A024E
MNRRDHRAASDAAVGIMVAIGVLVAVWPVVVAVAAPVPFAVLPVLAHVAGMLAGYGVLVLMTLMSRWPVLERGVGSDRLARWHARGGRIVLTLVLVHAWAATQAWADSREVSLSVALWQVLGMPWLISATVATVLLVGVAVVSVRIARRRLSYERWHLVHLLTYVAIALSFLHQLGGPDLAGRPVLQVLWALMYAHAFGLVLRHRVIAPVRAAARHRLRVAAVVPEAPGVVSIILDGEHLGELRAEPGQFFRWRFLTPDTWLTAHPFSLSAPPGAHRLRLTVKALGDGSRLLQAIEVGTWVVAEGPYGAMTADLRTRREVLLVAGGVGITPMRALFETMPLGPGTGLTLLYRARDRDQIVFRAELDAIATHRGARVVYLLGDDPDLLSAASLLRLVPNLAEHDVYLCGPPGMAQVVRTNLEQAGLPVEQLHEERFAF